MSRFREWLRPPRNLLVFFALIVCLPAATLIVLGIRLLDQERVLARQRQIELLDRAADRAVGVLQQKLLAQMKSLDLAHAISLMLQTIQSALCFTRTESKLFRRTDSPITRGHNR